jgi:hypothetical protein
MALAFQEAAPLYRDESVLSPDVEEHVRTYRKFVHYAAIAACGVPVLVAFVLYWFN